MQRIVSEIGEGLGLAAVLGLVGLTMPESLIFIAVQLFCLLYTTHRLAPRFFPDRPFIPRLLLTLATLLAVQSILQTIAYYADVHLGTFTDILSEIGSILIVFTIGLRLSPKSLPRNEPASDIAESISYKEILSQAMPLITTVMAAVYIMYQASTHATIEAIRTPWILIPLTSALLSCIVMTFATWFSASKQTSRHHLVWTITSIFFITLSLFTPLLYPIGFGFDGFLHRASENVLLDTGTLQPKPFYYIGQYTLVTWLARLFSVSVTFIDVWLLVACIALLPAAITHHKRSTLLIFSLLILVPLSLWTTTTPQSLAYLMGLVGLFLAFTRDEQESLFPCLAFALWSIMIHPLAGLPFALVTLLALFHSTRFPIPDSRFSFLISAAISLTTALIVPLAFFFHSLRSSAHIEWHLDRLFTFPHAQEIWSFFSAPPLRISMWADWSAFVSYLWPFALVLLTLIGLHKFRSYSPARLPPFSLAFTGLLVILTGWIMQHIAVFTFLIEYERQNYTTRLMLIGQLLLLPIALEGGRIFFEKIKRASFFLFSVLVMILSAWQGARIYHAFPYHDATHIEHGWNVSAADQEAVRWIERDSQNTPYTVLANQSVSAAAIAELGFKRYANEIFFYPLPTGGPLYQVFLRASRREVTKNDIEKAAELGQTSRVYLVLNAYWWQAEEVAQQLARLADASYEIDRGRIRIYRFDVKSLMNR